MQYNFITLGFNCSSATVLRDLGLRKTALPFDWIVINHVNKFINCIEDNFQKFHKNLHLIMDNHWLEDEYGIQYPHDYSLNDNGEICDDWMNYKTDVLKKYEKRIERFHNILNDPLPIIALYHGPIAWGKRIKWALEKKYNRRNIIFVIATYEQGQSSNDIIICNISTNEDSRNKDFWINGINEAIRILTTSTDTKYTIFNNKTNRWKMF
uniref:Papain-like cysteine peptidase n=1 Tax=viral metagenome TaxID=1070528 RepID=A0A6C0JJI1_9ZZZZ